MTDFVDTAHKIIDSLKRDLRLRKSQAVHMTDDWFMLELAGQCRQGKSSFRRLTFEAPLRKFTCHRLNSRRFQ